MTFPSETVTLYDDFYGDVQWCELDDESDYTVYFDGKGLEIQVRPRFGGFRLGCDGCPANWTMVVMTREQSDNGPQD